MRKAHTRHTRKINDKRTAERANAAIARDKQREGLHYDKHRLADKRYKAYCDEYNRASHAQAHDARTHNTHGGWQLPKRWASGKSQWERWAEEELSQKNTTIEEIKRKTRPVRHSAVIILYDKQNNEAGAYAGRVHNTRHGTHITLIGVPKLKISVHRTRADEWSDTMKLTEINGEKIRADDLIRTAMIHGAEIYTLE